MDSPESDKKDVRRPMNAFLIFCKRHRAIVREKHPDLDNRSVTKILGDLWANLGEEDKSVYTKLAKQYKDAFMKANPDYKWYNPEKVLQPPTKMTTRPTNIRLLNGIPEISLDGKIMPGKLADPSNMGGLNLLLMAGQHFMSPKSATCTTPEKEKRVTSLGQSSPKSALLELAEMCANELQLDDDDVDGSVVTKQAKSKTVRSKKQVSDCRPQNQPNIHKSQHDSGSGNDAIRKPKSKLTKWRMKKSGDPGPASQRQFDKFKVVDFCESGKFTSRNKRIRHKSESCVSEFVPKTDTDRDSQFRSIKEEFKKFSRVFTQGGGNSSFDEKIKCKRFRRTSNGETLAECLSDQNDNPLITADNGSSVVAMDDGSSVVATDDGSSFVAATDDGSSVVATKDSSSVVAADDSNKMTSSLNEVKFKAKVKKNSCVTEVKEIKQEVTDEGEVLSSFGKPVENVGVPEESLPAGMATEFTGIEEKVEAGMSESDGRYLEKKKSASPEFEEIHVKEEKLDPDFNAGNEEDQDLQPIRKSRRRNRGQRYQELIDEGIIQPSKERLAARRAEKSTGSCVGESLLVCDESFYDEEVVELRLPAKRSASETEITDERKYKTGDFDLEAHIAVLPACSLEQFPKGRKMAKVRHNSEGSPRKALSSDLAQTLILPPHVKVKSPEHMSELVTGSRKRKARKHSITHLISTKSEQNTSLDNIKSNEDSKETILPISKDFTETTEKIPRTDSLNMEDRITQNPTVKREPELETKLSPESDTKSQTHDAQVMQDKCISNVSDKKAIPSVDQNRMDDLCDCVVKQDGLENDRREGILKVDENGKISRDLTLDIKSEGISTNSSGTTAETEFMSRSDSSLPSVLSRMKIKSDSVAELSCSSDTPTIRARNTLQDLCRSVITHRGLPLKYDSQCSPVPVSMATVNADMETEKWRPVLNDKSQAQSSPFSKKIKSEIAECDISSEKLLDKNESVEKCDSHVVTMATDEMEERQDRSSLVTETSQKSVAMETDEQKENCFIDERSSELVESSTSVADSFVATVTDSATLFASEVAMVSSTTTSMVNPMSHSADSFKPSAATASSVSMVSTSATTESSVSMVSTSAATESSVSMVSTSAATESSVSMVSTSAATESSVSMVSTSTATENSVSMVSTSAATESSVSMVTTSAATESSVSMVSTSATIASSVSTSAAIASSVSIVSASSATIMSPVSMVSTSASTVMNPVAMVSSPVTAVASPVSAVSSPVTAVCS